MQKRRKNKLAVFDIDGTIFRSSLLIELVSGLIAAGIFPKSARRDFELEHERWLNREDSYDRYLLKIITSYNTRIKGIRDEKIWSVARRVIDEQKNRTYRYTRDLVQKLGKTHFLLAISGSPVDIVTPYCKELGFDKVYGRIYEVDSKSKFTGRMVRQDMIDHKDKILKRAVLRENLTLSGSIGIGDSETDIPMLRLVEHPIAFNPNKKLFRVAKKNGWEVVVERKDMIYRLFE